MRLPYNNILHITFLSGKKLEAIKASRNIRNQRSNHSGNIVVLSSISSIWEDNLVEKLENNQWKCLWCDIKFQSINEKNI